MRKIVLLIISLFLVSIMAAHAEGIDLSGMSDKELTELAMQINEELHSRSLVEAQYLYQGMYEVGKDIEPGRYVFKSEKVIENKREYGEIYLSEEHQRPQGTRMQAGDEWSARLNEGAKLWLTYLECAFVKID